LRAVVVDREGVPRLGEVAEPAGEGELVDVVACGLCGSDVEKLGPATAGLVLGHEVVGRTADGRRVALVHHAPCGECERCRAGHESTCERFGAPTILPGGFAERALATGGVVELPQAVGDAVATYAEPLGCVLRALERLPEADAIVVGGGFVGRLFAWALRRRGASVHVLDRDPARSDGPAPGTAPVVVLAAPGGADDALALVEPGGTLLVFADAGTLDVARVYREEITVAGSRSATPRHLAEAAPLLPELDLPTPLVVPFERFAEGLERYRRRETLKVVVTP
jgi:L-iditol 2-dehydrogenase